MSRYVLYRKRLIAWRPPTVLFFVAALLDTLVIFQKNMVTQRNVVAEYNSISLNNYIKGYKRKKTCVANIIMLLDNWYVASSEFPCVAFWTPFWVVSTLYQGLSLQDTYSLLAHPSKACRHTSDSEVVSFPSIGVLKFTLEHYPSVLECSLNGLLRDPWYIFQKDTSYGRQAYAPGSSYYCDGKGEAVAAITFLQNCDTLFPGNVCN